MKAVAYQKYGGPEVLEVIEVEKPVPKEGEVLIKVGASGVNPVDTYFRSGVRPVDHFPYIPHFDLGGTIAEVGPNVEKWKVGDRVWGTNINGTSAEYVVATESNIFSLADHLSEEDGAALSMAFMTAYIALFHRARISAGETILIYGAAGAVGNAAVQLAKNHGATVIATASSSGKAKIAQDAGADKVILYTETSLVDAVQEFTNNNGVSVILDMSLSENIEQNFEVLTYGGRIVTIGSPKNNTPVLPWRLLNMKNASLIGVLLFTSDPKEFKEAGEEVSQLFAEKKLTTHIAKVFNFEEAQEAHQALESKKYSGNILIKP
ncbi:NADPH:quinone reductase [Alkalihalobacterium alkalinitrilicum]|uniref:NADPH:quinone reductase n=1 Tax=Alkalihalobacterium alkalinitrilicum TaxID=427920 RepID=UPI000994CF9E|nr:NADPH:quinone reductase [Alkalihalobacterium alkalinitrilicum]